MAKSREKRIVSIDSAGSKGRTRRESADSKKQEDKVEKASNPAKYIISKKTPTAFNQKVDAVICETTSNAFVACGNTILVYSLQTGLQFKTMRSRRTPGADSKSKETGDMHKANIVMLAKKSEGVLMSLCSKGTLAEWDIGE